MLNGLSHPGTPIILLYLWIVHEFQESWDLPCLVDYSGSSLAQCWALNIIVDSIQIPSVILLSFGVTQEWQIDSPGAQRGYLQPHMGTPELRAAIQSHVATTKHCLSQRSPHWNARRDTSSAQGAFLPLPREIVPLGSIFPNPMLLPRRSWRQEGLVSVSSSCITRHHRLRDLNTRHLFSPSSTGSKSKVKGGRKLGFW